MSDIRRFIRKISPYMKAKGYTQKNRCFYHIINDIAYCIELEAPSDTLYVWYYFMPLYIPSEHRHFTYGERLNYHPKKNLPLIWTDADDEEIERWSKRLYSCLEERVFPYFEALSSPEALLMIDKWQFRRIYGGFPCPDVFIWELKVFTYLFVGKYDEAEKAEKNYCSAITKAHIRKECFLEKLELLEKIRKEVLLGPHSPEKYFQHVICETQQNCFDPKSKK